MRASRAGGRARRVRHGVDPRHIVVAGALLALTAVGTSAAAMARLADDGRESVEYIRTSIEVPLAHLADVRKANTAGQSLLQQAVATTGDERNARLTGAIASSDAATEAWTSYIAVALPLEGEAELAAKYSRGVAASAAVSAEIIVPIVQSNEVSTLPTEQIVAAEKNRQDLNELSTLYELEREAALHSLDAQITRAKGILLASAAALSFIILLGALIAQRIASRVVTARRARAAAAELAEFEARLMRALELVDDDVGAFRVATKAAAEILPDVALSVVATGATPSSFATVVGTSACSVDSPDRCPAIRAGSLLEFRDSDALDACPVLGSAAEERCSVSCMPVSVAGSQVAVVQLIGPVDEPPEMGAAGRLVVRRVGERITMLRAFARSERQASRDSLTGLLNRRSLHAAVEQLAEAGTPYSVAFADLDHFKRLNDAFGHDAGDQALREFAATLSGSLRPEDLSCRWGGEEFLVVLPSCDEGHTVEAMDRVRGTLAARPRDLSKTVHVSMGVAEHQATETFAETVARADEALLQAKGRGRDQVVAWAPSPADDGASVVLAGARGR